MQKSLLCLFLVTVYTATAVSVTAVNSDIRFYPRYIDSPDGEGDMHTVDAEAKPDKKLFSEIERDLANDSEFLLFTNRNKIYGQPLTINDTDSITSSNFNEDVPTVVIAHGWLGSQYSDINPTIRDAYLEKSDVNIIVLDWSSLAMSDYATATRGVPAVGRRLGQLMAFINRVTGQSYKEMHLVGFSLGAHVVGYAGREVKGQIARITALDPAGPLWYFNSNRIRPGDAAYVEAIHTNAGYTIDSLGTSINVGNVDFYPNGGTSQPGCFTNLCNHNRSWELFAATVTYNHLVGRFCASKLELLWNTCHGDELPMGNDDLQKWGYGTYRVNTGSTYPY